MLTEREYKIAIKLLETQTPIHIKDMSKEFQVSTRMIQYDLMNVKDWLNEYGLKVHSQHDIGIWVEEHGISKDKVLKNLIMNEEMNRVPDQPFRLRKIITTLILSEDYVTAAELSGILGVSRNTILNDMNIVEKYITSWEIQLDRKKRVGYKLIGEELNLRLLLENLIYSNLSNYEIYQIITRITSDSNNSEKFLFIEESIHDTFYTTQQIMSEIYSNNIRKTFNQKDLITLLIRVTIALIRLSMGKTIKGYRVLKKTRYKDQVSSFIITFMEKSFAQFELPLLEDEFLYISGDIVNFTKRINLVDATYKIIRYVSQKEGIEYHKDPKLFNNLFAHFSLRFQRGIFNVTENNPFTKEIKQSHPRLFQHVSEACVKYLGSEILKNQDDFISLIVIHFLTSYDKLFRKRNNVQALYVCATGKGVARVIKNRVEQEIPGIEIVSYCSIMDVHEICEHVDIDLIISVFPINIDIPVIVTDAIPTRNDINNIKEKVFEIIEHRNITNEYFLFMNQRKNLDDPEELSKEIILKGFEIFQAITDQFMDRIKTERLLALELHIFLMVHRYYFEKQYDDFLYSRNPINEEDAHEIQVLKNIFKEKNLHINASEIFALMQYFK